MAGVGLGVAQGNERRREETRVKERKEDQRERQIARERAENPALRAGTKEWVARQTLGNKIGERETMAKLDKRRAEGWVPRGGW